MPITLDEKVALDDALAAFSDKDSVVLGRILYETLLAAKLGPKNPNGMGFKACTSLGRMVKEKGDWENLKSVEGAIEAAIRLPLIKSADTVFRSRIATDLPDLPEEHKQTIAYVFGKMEGDELITLTRLLYETVVNTEFPNTEAQEAFGKLFYSGYSWEELGRSDEIKKGILGPIVMASHYFLREALSNAFEITEPEKTEAEEAQPEVQEGQPPEKDQLEGQAQPQEQGSETTSEDGTEEVSEDGEGAQPMPLPEFADQAEIEARRQADAAKPAFREGKKKKNKKRRNTKNGRAEAPPKSSETVSGEAEASEPSESAPDAAPASDDTPETETVSSDPQADSEAPSTTQDDTAEEQENTAS